MVSHIRNGQLTGKNSIGRFFGQFKYIKIYFQLFSPKKKTKIARVIFNTSFPIGFCPLSPKTHPFEPKM